MKTILLIGIVGVLYAQSGYDTYVAMLKQDPSLCMLHHQEQALRLGAKEQAALDDPQLIVGVDNLPVEEPAFDRYLPTSKVVGISQKFSAGRQEAAHVKESEGSKRILESDYGFQRLEATFYAALVNHRLKSDQLRNLNEQKQLFSAMKEEISNQLYSGRDVTSELSRIDERELDITSRILFIESDLKMADNLLKRLVNEIPDVTIPKKSLKAWESNQLLPVLLAMQEEKTAQAKSALAEARNSVDFSMQLLYKQREPGKTFDGEDWLSINAVMTMPFWGKKETTYLSSLQAQQSALESIELQRLIWTQKMQDIHVRYEQTEKRMALLNSRIAAIKETIRSLEERYDVGHGRYLGVLESKLRLLDAEFTLSGLEAEISILAAEQNSHIME